jgi:hypothetical protein|tara:strand:- start:4671 stop:5150 length:480 start_codon:yes stop_codon:yes gene_type:complete
MWGVRSPHFKKGKSMKSFNKFIKENIGTSDQQNTVDPAAYGYSMSDFSNPEVVKRLNAYIGRIADVDHVLPEQTINTLRQKLMRFGLSFGKAPMMTEDSGVMDLPLTSMGGRFGKDENTPHDEFLNDDGISHKVEGGLSLRISYEMQENNSCKLTAKIQ